MQLDTSVQKQVIDIEKNQDILIHSLKNYNFSSKTLLLDGHFCLLNTKFEITKIPLNTFQYIAPEVIIIITEKEEIIIQRLIKRDNKYYNLNFIKEFQNQEIEHAKYISKFLEIPYLIINPDTRIDDVISFLKINTK